MAVSVSSVGANSRLWPCGSSILRSRRRLSTPNLEKLCFCKRQLHGVNTPKQGDRKANGPDAYVARGQRWCRNCSTPSVQCRFCEGSPQLPALALDARAAAVKYSRACGKPRTAFVDSCYVRKD
jgi:hypothetical protein